MYKKVEKPKENKSRAAANAFSRKKGSSQSTFQFVDKRSETIQMRRLQKLPNISSRNAPLQFSDNRPRIMQMERLQEVTNNSSQNKKNRPEKIYQLVNKDNYYGDDLKRFMKIRGFLKDKSRAGWSDVEIDRILSGVSYSSVSLLIDLDRKDDNFLNDLNWNVHALDILKSPERFIKKRPIDLKNPFILKKINRLEIWSEDKLIGFLDYEKNSEIRMQGSYSILGSVLGMVRVEDDYQGKGLASKLMYTYFKLVPAPYILEVADGDTKPETLIEIYRKKGFEKCGKSVQGLTTMCKGELMTKDDPDKASVDSRNLSDLSGFNFDNLSENSQQ